MNWRPLTICLRLKMILELLFFWDIYFNWCSLTPTLPMERFLSHEIFLFPVACVKTSVSQSYVRKIEFLCYKHSIYSQMSVLAAKCPCSGTYVCESKKLPILPLLFTDIFEGRFVSHNYGHLTMHQVHKLRP